MIFDFFAVRTRTPAQGSSGGRPGALRKLFINGKESKIGLRIAINPRDEFMVREAGGGGYGDPRERPVEKVLEDFKNGFVSIDGALKDYGVRIDPEHLLAERLQLVSAEA